MNNKSFIVYSGAKCVFPFHFNEMTNIGCTDYYHDNNGYKIDMQVVKLITFIDIYI